MLSDVGRLRTLSQDRGARLVLARRRRLGYTQSAISQQIAALEHEVQLTLLNRAVRPVALTDAGRVLVEHAEPMLQHIAAAEAQLDALRGLRAGRLRAGRLRQRVRDLPPDRDRRVPPPPPGRGARPVEAEPDVSLPMLRTGEVDLALVYGFTDPGDDADRRLQTTPLLDRRASCRPAAPATGSPRARPLSVARPRRRGLDRPPRRRAGARLPGGARAPLRRRRLHPAASRSRPTTCRPRRPSSPPAWGSPSCTTSRCRPTATASPSAR